ncbi:biotin transporter BioY [Halopelagius longus]|uniref:Biotin transport system substrate-specific component n=1 Tax=Halopelagius longus TaxID=1236180 RepID=A0A1H1E8J7_9EURY|nr:biotin transporter BioY [Halopelagius longus]RDI71650.1 biotin transporter BioY [Halopelagius longus]SDQ85013.1 biotin transport system substrate-specific component [Halopelagius longus]
MATETESVELVGDESARNIARAVLFAAVTSATAPVDLVHPLVPNVPITLQTLWVFLAGVVLGPLWAGVSFVLYAVGGAIGLPVFAGGSSGLGVILGPTGGFIVSYPVAASVVGLVAHGTGNLSAPGDIPLPRVVAAMVAGSAVIYAIGTVGFSVVQGIGLLAAVSAVVVPFLPVAAVKIAVAAAVTRSDAIVAR